MATEDNSHQRERNADLKREWNELTARIERLEAAGEPTARLERKRKHIADDFCAENKGLATTVAQKFFASGGKANHDDYVADAMFGLWEAFLKWDPDRPVVTPSGKVTKSTFGNFSRSYMEGRVRRGVATLEAEGLSYGDFTARPDVRRAEERLSDTLDRPPTADEIAAETGYTPALVDRVRQARPSSLDKTVGEGDTTLGDLVALGELDIRNLTEDDDAHDASEIFERLTAKAPVTHKDGTVTIEYVVRPTDLFTVIRYHGLDGAPPQRYPALARITGINRETLRRRHETAEEAIPALAKLRRTAS